MANGKKGDILNCEVCGLVLTVDALGNAEMGEILCCSEPMAKREAAKPKKTAASAKTAKKPATKKAAVKAKKAKAAKAPKAKAALKKTKKAALKKK
ncbi:MAG: hypothetical protein ABSB79_03190 [Syntrophales bacterium]|jgi:hypothetical protein